MNRCKGGFISALFILLLPTALSAQELPLHLLNLPEGFKVSVYAQGVETARQMALSPDGVLYVGTRKGGGRVYRIFDDNKDYVGDRTEVIAEGLNSPNGVTFRGDDLYVGEIHRITKFPNIDQQKGEIKTEVIYDKLSRNGWHGWKYIKFGPDGKLYIPIGGPCNVCEHVDERFATIARLDVDTKEFDIFARGIRNSVGIDWHPENEELWFTDNGRDNLGDNLPPDELNHAPKKGMHFGFPYCHGKGIKDPEFGDKRACSTITLAAQELGPHVASLGMIFYRGDMFPVEYQNQIFIAEHGSWNRSTKIGYRVSLVKLKENKPISYETFIDGWLDLPESVWGRPVDILEMSDGSILISDDYLGTIFRITYSQED